MTQGLALANLIPIGSVLNELDSGELTRVPANEISVDSQALYHHNNSQVSLSKEAELSFLKAAQIPHKFAARQPADLRASIVRYWLENDDSLREGHFLINEDSVAETFLPRGSEWIRPHELLSVIQQNYGDNLLVRKIDHNARSFHASLVAEAHHFDMAEHTGDALEDHIYGGITIDHSITGEFATKIVGSMFRLVCSNGMILSQGERITRHVAGDKGRWEPRLLGAVETVLGTMNRQFELLSHTAHNDAPGVEALIESLKLLITISPKLADAIRNRFAIDQPKTLYDALNVITSIAHELDGKLSRQAELVGGVIINHTEACTACGRLV